MTCGWSFYKTITIKGSSGAGTNYQVKLLVGESSGASGYDFHVEGHSAIFPSGKNDSGDLRFTDTSDNLLDFWVEDVSGDSPNRLATIWVKVSANLDTDQDILCCYGNSNADNVSNAINTFLQFGDFSGSSLQPDWVVTNVNKDGSVSVSDGKLTLSNENGADVWDDTYEATHAYKNSPIDCDFETVAHLVSQKNTHEWAKTGIFCENEVKAQDNNGMSGMIVTPSNDFVYSWQTGYKAWNNNAQSDSSYYPVYLKLQRVGSTTTGYFSSDGSSWKEVASNTPTAAASSQYVGLISTPHSTSATSEDVYDFYFTRKYVSTEPSFDSASSENSILKISGQVTLNGVAVSGAIVRVIDQNGSYFGDANTDSNGYYSICYGGSDYYHIVVEYTDGNGNKYNAASLWDIQGIKNT